MKDTHKKKNFSGRTIKPLNKKNTYFIKGKIDGKKFNHYGLGAHKDLRYPGYTYLSGSTTKKKHFFYVRLPVLY